jgi:hypothetical protein
MPRPFWTMKAGPERQAAREAYYASRPELPEVPRGHAPVEFEVNGKRGFVGTSGFHWPYTTDLEKRVARVGAASDLRPDATVKVVEENDAIYFVGRSGARCVAMLDSRWEFRASYGAAIEVERTLASQKPTTIATSSLGEAEPGPVVSGPLTARGV